MPLIENSDYTPPLYCLGKHMQTILPNVTRRRWRVAYRRERIELADGDFVDLDWGPDTVDSQRAVLILHGLEGDSRAPYVKSFVRATLNAGYAAAVLNFRGCSGEMNRLARSYHSGDTGDIRIVVERMLRRYQSVDIVGFSLGGNVVLKYLGERPDSIPAGVRSAAAFSVPCHLASAALQISSSENRFYMKRFIKLLCAKIETKQHMGFEQIDSCGCRSMKSFMEFDGRYTSQLNGFRDAEDYWEKSSSLQFLDSIRVSTLLVNCANDPFLSKRCFPREAARKNPWLHLEMPEEGGHCGFPGRKTSAGYWHERRALAFFEHALKG